MEPHRSWPHQGGGSSNDPQRPPGAGFGPGTPQQPPTQQSPPGSSFPPFHQGHAHSLANLAGISQSSPRQPPSQSSHRPEDPQSRPPPAGPGGFGLPSLSQATGQPPSAAERERDREREREREREEHRIHIKEEEDRRHREQERQRLEQAPPHQAQQGPPVHLHQPVAVGPRTVHGPNGLLGNPQLAGPGPGPQPQPHLPLGAPSGPANIFAGGPVQPSQAAGSQQMQPGLLAPYAPGGPAQGQPPQPPQQPQQQMGGQQQQQQQGQQQGQGQGQGQQPILNDALSYLDQVKVQFADHPDVYNRFLDIMKDFKSGAIDTPGVIGRVSTLFAGNPELIQGFNTFLPPGYRIECGTGDDPNSIRVTTPMGTTVSSMPQPRPLSRQEGAENYRPSNGTYTPQPGGAQQLFGSPSARAVGPAATGQQHLSPLEAARQAQEQQAMHQQEQRGVNSLQSAVSAATGGAGLRAGISPRATPMPGGDGAAGAEGVAPEKRGPVEFNHAISYVNKIKNRFASHPDIYKQFLEILQTYQRESKPIQDVYSQVTHLFKTAPDLLEDFKQFLPESAAHAKQAAERARQEAENNVPMSNVRGEGGGMYGSPVMSREPHVGTPGHGGKLPPVGNFAPTPASKDNKRKRDQRQGTAGAPDGIPGPSNAKTMPGQNKRMKAGAGQVIKGPNDQPPTSPTLIPSLPAPIEPTTTSAATSEELQFFDKAKKAIGNKNTMNEFLKLCNLFSQDLVTREMLISRAKAFIGSNPDLMKWFTDWLGYDERDVLIENKPRVPTGRVMLSNCRGLGPSYRLLPKRERQKPCSGRDELCNSVLNDDWASHPTWASEDSGFIAHRKNVHEEGLHRIEEERHDYDYNIEACSRTIQLLEPIAQQLRRSSDAEQKEYRLPPGLGGQSETIYKRVIMKLYGREKGKEVINSLHERPYQVIPVLLNRLRERLESWKMAQREWEKVWREQTQKMFWKSLDHQGVDTKKNDRRQFQTKTLQSEIQVKYEESRRQAQLNPAVARQPQYEVTVDDPDVLADTASLLLDHVSFNLGTDSPKLFSFIRDFVSLFFGLDPETFQQRLENSRNESPSNENADDTLSGGEDTASKSRKGGSAKNNGLLRAALDRGRPLSRNNDSNASGSRASTPGNASNADDEMAVDPIAEAENRQDVGSARWLEHPIDENKMAGKNVNPHEPQPRTIYRLWANTSIFCFFRLFLMLYERLCKLKNAEGDVREAVKNAQRVKPAIELGIIDKLPTDFFERTDEHADYYSQMLDKFRDVLRGDLEYPEVEDCLRRFYLQNGYQLYPFEKIIQTMARDADQIMKSDSKDKSADIYALFKKDRQRESTTAQQQNDYRKAVEKMVKDSEVYRIDYDQVASKVKIYLSKRDDIIADDGLSVMDRENRWRYYIASYTSVDPTDGVDTNSVSQPLLWRSIRAFGADPDEKSFTPEGEERANSMKNDERLVVRVAVNNYKSIFHPNSEESFHASLPRQERGEEGVEAADSLRGQRDDEIMDKFVRVNEAMKDMSTENVESANSSFSALIEKGSGAQEEGEGMEVDD